MADTPVGWLREQLEKAIARATYAEENPRAREFGTCTSCGDRTAVELCHGCKRVLCQTCGDVFDHFGDGLHGTGNWREKIPQVEAFAKHLTMVHANCTCMGCTLHRRVPHVVVTMGVMTTSRVNVRIDQLDFSTPHGLGAFFLLVATEACYRQVLEPAILASGAVDLSGPPKPF